MIALLQRVNQGRVTIDDQAVANIKKGLVVFIGIASADNEKIACRLIDKIINYRVFSDEQDKMNLSLLDIMGDLLLVPQFTLVANTQKGLRPSFSNVMSPEIAKNLFEMMAGRAQQSIKRVGQGVFGADMQINLTNDGPVTFQLNIGE